MTQTYKIVNSGKHSSRRDYSKVSGNLDLPNLVEVQTDSFRWFTKEGIKEVFDDIYPIQNYSGNIRLKLLNFEFGEPKFSVAETKYREEDYRAPLKANMELEIIDEDTGEVITGATEDLSLTEGIGGSKVTVCVAPSSSPSQACITIPASSGE